MTNKINTWIATGAIIMALVLTFSASTVVFAREGESDDDRGRSALLDNSNRGRQEGNAFGLLKVRDGEQAELRVDQNGKFTATGLVVNSSAATVTNGVAAGSVNVKFFGLNFAVRVDGATLEGAPATSTVANIAAGDKLSIAGSIDKTTGVIKAERILDHTLAVRRTGDIQARIAELLRMVEQLREQLRLLGR